MSHPAILLKKYLTELNERVGKLDVKSDGDMRTVIETISTLDKKLDGNVQTTNEALSTLDKKLDGNVQTTNEALSRLDAKLDDGIRPVSETISKLDQKLDNNVQATNQAIGDLYREKLSVQEFRDFVNLFNKILGENLPVPEETVPQTLKPASQESHPEDNSGFQIQTVVNIEPESDAPQHSAHAAKGILRP